MSHTCCITKYEGISKIQPMN